MDIAFEEYDPDLMDDIQEAEIASVFTKLSTAQN